MAALNYVKLSLTLIVIVQLAHCYHLEQHARLDPFVSTSHRYQTIRSSQLSRELAQFRQHGEHKLRHGKLPRDIDVTSTSPSSLLSAKVPMLTHGVHSVKEKFHDRLKSFQKDLVRATVTTVTIKPSDFSDSRRFDQFTQSPLNQLSDDDDDADDADQNDEAEENELDDEYDEDDDDVDIDEEKTAKRKQTMFDSFEMSSGKNWQAEDARKLNETNAKAYKPVRDTKPSADLRQESLKRNEVQKVTEHLKRVYNAEGQCRTPLPRLVPIQQYYSDISKTYSPHCTILHRCSDQSGCCKTPKQTCVPKTSENVQLYFFVTSPGKAVTIEKLLFENHTQCECMDKKEWARRDDAVSKFTHDESLALQDQHHQHNRAIHSHLALKSNADVAQLLQRCRCPSLYQAVFHLGQCRCDCEPSNFDCVYMKSGNEYFSFVDRLCIQSGQCHIPACEYGHYQHAKGRCMTKSEKFDMFSRYPNTVA